MRTLKRLSARFANLFTRHRDDVEFGAELDAHLALMQEEFERQGISPEQARREARLRLGGLEQVRELHREANGIHWLESLAQDIHFAARGIRKRPGFALAVVVTAALGIGATTSVFSVVDRLLFRSLPYTHEEHLVSVGMMTPLDTNEFFFAAPYLDLRRNPGPFESVTSFQAGSFACDLTDESPVRLKCLKVESNFLQTLGVTPLAGRMFSREEDVPNGPPVAMISHGLWRSRFAADPHVIGRTIPLDGLPTEIIGVLPSDFEVPTLTLADVLLPEQLNDAEHEGRAFRVFARLKPGITITQARAQLGSYFERALQTVPAAFRKEVALRVRSIRDRQADDFRPASLALFGAVLSVLLIACANVANLLLARALKRQREFAMRSALGATRSRLVRQALTESVTFALFSGTAGCALAYGLLRLFIAIAPAGMPRLASATIDPRVLLFALGLSLGSGLLFGIIPALRIAGTKPLGEWHATDPAKDVLGSSLVTVQIALSVILLTGAGLLLRSLWKLQAVPLGIETSHVITAQFVLGLQRYNTSEEQAVFFQRLEQRVAAIPGLESFAVSDGGPISGGYGRPLATIAVEGKAARPEGTGGMVKFGYVTPGYFATYGIPIIDGRGFDEQDRSPDAHSVMVNNLLAKLLFPGEEPIGQHILRDAPGPWFMVVGVVGDVKDLGPASHAEPAFYLVRKNAQNIGLEGQTSRAAILSIRTAIPPRLVAQTMRAEINQVDPTLPVTVQTMAQRIDQITARPRFDAFLLSGFAGLGAWLAASGLFGVMSLLVAQRTRDIGVRMALGATPAEIVRWTLKRAVWWVLSGLALGVFGSYAVARVLRSLLFGITPNDPAALASAVVVLCVVAVLAATLPARRATRVDPMVALRAE